MHDIRRVSFLGGHEGSQELAIKQSTLLSHASHETVLRGIGAGAKKIYCMFCTRAFRISVKAEIPFLLLFLQRLIRITVDSHYPAVISSFSG